MIRAVIFDVGHTLVDYKNPLNWSALYRDALKVMYEKCGLIMTQDKMDTAVSILTKYNTRVYPRTKEVSCDTIFREIFAAAGDDIGLLDTAINSFFDFFQNGAVLFEGARELLAALKARDLKVGVLTDVAYGMERSRAFKDFCELESWIDLWYTSVDVGYRKPALEGYRKFADRWKIPMECMLYVGDEEKDITGANAAGMYSVLIDRKGKAPDFGQRYTVRGLEEILGLCK